MTDHMGMLSPPEFWPLMVKRTKPLTWSLPEVEPLDDTTPDGDE